MKGQYGADWSGFGCQLQSLISIGKYKQAAHEYKYTQSMHYMGTPSAPVPCHCGRHFTSNIKDILNPT